MKDIVLMLYTTVPIPEMIYIAEDITVNVGIFPNHLIAAILVVIRNTLTTVIFIEEEGIIPQPLNVCHQQLVLL